MYPSTWTNDGGLQSKQDSVLTFSIGVVNGREVDVNF